jgi:hypothetical protein
MSTAAQLAKKLESLGIAEGLNLIDKTSQSALYFNVIGDAMCVMHDDGSVNIIENRGKRILTTEVITPENILKVLHHYRPFKDVFKGMMQ